jgi:valyl-tRNA synthetase
MATPPARPVIELPPQYDPSAVEAPAYDRWIAADAFTAGRKENADKPPFSLVIPPPNVTGSLHMGHAFEHVLMDALTRLKRMQQYDVLWLPGMDHAGIATQNVVERQLGEEGLSRQDLGREAFLERVWAWKAEYGGKILGQMRRLGDGVDWSRERFTMDEGLTRAVRTVFKRLYDQDLIYRAERIINWCPRHLTAISDIEVDHKDIDGELVTIQYGPLTVATTRAETMLGDTAVAVHPDDERYKHLIGTEVPLPLTGRMIPVVGDQHVDPAFGSGAVKVTPAHDPNDFEIGQRHGLPSITVLDESGAITTHGPFQGMDRFEARPAIVEALREEGLIVAEKRPYVHSVGHCSRCGTVVEPRLSLQWFVAVAKLAKRAGDAVRGDETQFYPPEMAARFFSWVDNMHDWCVSRQLWWGHRIPVWYGPNGETVVPGVGEEPPSGEGWRQDEDVLDTWFSSALWPASTLGWPDHTPDFERFYPTSVLITGYDIIFFWVARMMMFCTFIEPGVPFERVMVHGLVRDARGKKMSKSKGNVVDPLVLIDAYGADALRWTLARAANPGGDVPLSEEWVQGSRNFINKLWNATRFALMNGADPALPLDDATLSLADRWILTRLSQVSAEVDALYDAFEFGRACDALFHFAWDELFDWYVELAKVPMRGDAAAVARTQAVLGRCFDTLLRLLHPVIPFITDELWRVLWGYSTDEAHAETTLALAEWPSASGHADTEALGEFARLQELVVELRRFRTQQGIASRRKIGATLLTSDAGSTAFAEAWTGQLAALADLTLANDKTAPAGWEVLSAGGVHVALDLLGSIDVDAEKARIARALEVAAKEIKQTSAKLGNPGFLAKAPDTVVAEITGRHANAVAETERLNERLARLG